MPRLFHHEELGAERTRDPFALDKRNRPILPPPDEERRLNGARGNFLNFVVVA